MVYERCAINIEKNSLIPSQDDQRKEGDGKRLQDTPTAHMMINHTIVRVARSCHVITSSEKPCHHLSYDTKPPKNYTDLTETCSQRY